MLGLIARVRSFWRGMRGTSALDDEMREEFRAHIELRAADLERSGLSPEEAHRKARLEFGSTESYKDKGRESRGLRHFDALRVSWLDVKLGARMVARYPGLSVVSVIGMAIGIALGAGLLSAIALVTTPKLPLDEGDRVIGIAVTDAASRSPERRIVHDFERWRSEMRTVEYLGAMRDFSRTLITSDGGAEPTRVAEMSAAGFRVARVSPFLGRYLIEDDEKPGAAPVVVIGYEAWRNRFASDSGVVGQTVQLGEVKHTVVGVMPSGFAFPLNLENGMWVPLRVNALNHKPREGPVIYVFGRLAPGATLEDAQAELTTLGQRAAGEFPQTHARLRPRLLPYAQSIFELDNPEIAMAFHAARFMITLLLVVICGHVAILVYARTATRHSELAVRTALGASRARIIMQLFGESFALSALAALLGIGLLWLAFWQANAWFHQVVLSGPPFWVSLTVSARTIAYVAGLALLGAVIVGVLPALQATGRRVHISLQRLSGGHASVRLGNAWTALIIAEVALTVAMLPATASYSAQAIIAALSGPGLNSQEFLSATLMLEREASMGPDSSYARRFMARYDELATEVMERLKSDPRISGVTFASETPGGEPAKRLELDAAMTTTMATGASGGRTAAIQVERDGSVWIRTARVDVDFFDVLDVPVIAGRTFGRADADSTTRTAIVNRAFVQTLLGSAGGSALGRRFRMADSTRSQPWYEIVGVVENFPASPGINTPGVYLAARPGQIHAANLLMRVRNADPVTFAGRLLAITADVRPTLQVRFIRSLDDAYRNQQLAARVTAVTLGVITLSVLLLSTAGIYALMSVVVTQRRREIGIRMALGADRRRILTGVFASAARQLAAGAVVGLAASVLVDRMTGGEVMLGAGRMVLPAIAAFMMLVGLLAALGPARRGFRIQPTEALRAE